MKDGGSDIEVIKQLNDRGVGKKIIGFKPSQQLDNLNKKRDYWHFRLFWWKAVSDGLWDEAAYWALQSQLQTPSEQGQC